MNLEETATMLAIRHKFKFLVDSGLLVSAKVCHEPEADECVVCGMKEDRIVITICPYQPLDQIDLNFSLKEVI